MAPVSRCWKGSSFVRWKKSGRMCKCGQCAWNQMYARSVVHSYAPGIASHVLRHRTSLVLCFEDWWIYLEAVLSRNRKGSYSFFCWYGILSDSNVLQYTELEGILKEESHCILLGPVASAANTGCEALRCAIIAVVLYDDVFVANPQVAAWVIAE